MFWIFAACLTIIAVVAVIYPLTRKPRQLASADAYDLTIYKSQLEEIDSDVKRGLIEEKEAEAARAEVARRLLNAQAAIDAETASGGIQADRRKSGRKGMAKSGAEMDGTATNAKVAGVIALMVVPFVSLGIYFVLGSPSLESQPLAVRLAKAPEMQSLTELVASAERRLKKNPDDLEGWKALAPKYISIRRPDEAVKAYHNILRLEGETAENLANLGEVMFFREDGVMSEQVYRLFVRSNQLSPKALKPRFYLAVALGQQGKISEAIDAWKTMIADSDPDTPWVSFARGQIATLEKRIASDQSEVPTAVPHSTPQQSGEGSDTAPSGPSREDVEAAANMSDEDRQQMIENMVSQLAERLDSDGGTAEEWVRLIRAELVLNRPDMAARTVAKALDALQSDVSGLEKVKAAARSLGVSVNQ